MQLCSELDREDPGLCTHFVKAKSVSRDTIACRAALCCSSCIAACNQRGKIPIQRDKAQILDGTRSVWKRSPASAQLTVNFHPELALIGTHERYQYYNLLFFLFLVTQFSIGTPSPRVGE